jgi:hypothetical protein
MVVSVLGAAMVIIRGPARRRRTGARTIDFPLPA